MTNYTSYIAEYIADTIYEDLSPEVIMRVKLYIIDNLSNMIGGGELEPAKIIQDIFNQYGGENQATVFSNGKKIPAPHAAYINSFLSNMLDFDDTYKSFAHPGATVIPPSWAIAEKEQKTGKDLITAVALGYELSIRIGLSIYPSPNRRDKVWGFATWQTLGTAISTSKLLNLNKIQICDALGIAGMSAPLPAVRKLGMEPTERPFTWIKNNYGWSAMSGVFASELASKKIIGNRSILDGENGFWIMAGSDQVDFKALTSNLGVKNLLEEVSFKPYAACRWSHSAIDAANKIRYKHGDLTNKIKSINISTFKEAKRSLSESHPKNIIDAQFSLPYLISLELYNKSAAHGLSESDLYNSDIIYLSNLVYLTVDEKFEYQFITQDKMVSQIEITLNSGKTISQYVDYPKGDPKNPITKTEIEQKFINLVSSKFSEQLSEQIIEDILNLEEINNISNLIESWYEQ